MKHGLHQNFKAKFVGVGFCNYKKYQPSDLKKEEPVEKIAYDRFDAVFQNFKYLNLYI